LVDEVGSDPVRFMMLYRKNDAPLDFDLAKVLEQSKDNPVFYVQYAHARAMSVFRNAQAVFPQLTADAPELAKADLSVLQDPGEIELIKKLAAFPQIVDGAARAHEPHRLAFYLHDLASAFHAQWTKGNESPHLRFIQADDGTLTTARLALIRANAQVLASGLSIIGVHAPEEMR
jgi:arginyl-tRNA synthetase